MMAALVRTAGWICVGVGPCLSLDSDRPRRRRESCRGDLRQASVFVAVLGASSCTFAEATRPQTLADSTASHVQACAFYGGCAELVVPDNRRFAVRRVHRYEPDLLRSRPPVRRRRAAGPNAPPPGQGVIGGGGSRRRRVRPRRPGARGSWSCRRRGRRVDPPAPPRRDLRPPRRRRRPRPPRQHPRPRLLPVTPKGTRPC